MVEISNAARAPSPTFSPVAPTPSLLPLPVLPNAPISPQSPPLGAQTTSLGQCGGWRCAASQLPTPPRRSKSAAWLPCGNPRITAPLCWWGLTPCMFQGAHANENMALTSGCSPAPSACCNICNIRAHWPASLLFFSSLYRFVMWLQLSWFWKWISNFNLKWLESCQHITKLMLKRIIDD